SPAEININSLDLSNMEMAKISESPVILIADIDRGGVFASIVGTLQLLNQEDRKRVKGVIINKFRGNKDYFSDGIKMLEEIISIPVVGVVPFIDINLEEEDGACGIKNNVVAKSSIEKEKEFEKLSRHLRENLDFKKIYEIIFEDEKLTK
ncbi:AAA family ATPase, partial [Peptostreptococcus porci]